MNNTQYMPKVSMKVKIVSIDLYKFIQFFWKYSVIIMSEKQMIELK